MGPCQGKMCHRNSGLLMARELGVDPDEERVGVTTARPPHNPTSFSLLAARGYEPEKRTAIHHWHAEHGAKMLWAGDWKRPYDYGGAEDETAAVHESLGLIDVSTLGKLIVRGPEAAAFLERIYPNRYGDMKLARVRYGIVCGDDGSILDDGTVARLSETEYYVTTTSSGAGGMEQWFTWWNAVWGMDCQIVNVTSAIAAVNLAGPNARTALAKLTGLRPLERGLPVSRRRATPTIAGVPCLILRIGFVGELGYEIHYPTAAGEHLWGELMGAGEEFGVKPFGLEPQRVLRLEKMHVIIGQDTNAESQPLEAAMPWIVKLDKENDWIGRYSIEWYQRRGDRFALVGFEGQNGSVPKEGAQIIGAGGMPVGRVTSSRFSRRLGKSIGIAWVPAASSEEGTPHHDLGSLRRARSRRASAAAPSTTRTERCSGHERRRPLRLHVSGDGRDRRRAANADGAPPHRGGRGDRGARRLADRRLPRATASGDPWVVDVSHLGKLDLRATAGGPRRS